MDKAEDYAKRQTVRDAQHAAAYRQWFAARPPAEQARLKALGLDKADVTYHGSGMSDRDMAESPLASEEPDIIAQIEPERASELSDAATSADIDERVLDVLRRLLGEVLTQKNARLTLECLALACGLRTLQGESMTSIAKRHGLSRAAVSKRCVDITDKLNLPPSRSMRSRKARKACKTVQKQLRNFYERDRHQRK